MPKRARCRVSYYALEGEDTGDVTPRLARARRSRPSGTAAVRSVLRRERLRARACRRWPGEHNIKNALAAIAMAAEGAGVAVARPRASVAALRGRASAPGAARCRARRARLRRLRASSDRRRTRRCARSCARHPEGKLIAVFEPRSATASRKLHQDAYPGVRRGRRRAARAGRARRHPRSREARRRRDRGRAHAPRKHAETPASVDAIVERIVALADARRQRRRHVERRLRPNPRKATRPPRNHRHREPPRQHPLTRADHEARGARRRSDPRGCTGLRCSPSTRSRATRGAIRRRGIASPDAAKRPRGRPSTDHRTRSRAERSDPRGCSTPSRWGARDPLDIEIPHVHRVPSMNSRRGSTSSPISC